MQAEHISHSWRRYLRFSVRGLTVLVLVIVVWLAWLVRMSVAVGEGTTLAASWAPGCYRWFAVDWHPASWLGIQPE